MPWIETARREYRRDCPRYASDLTDGEWALVEPFMPPSHRIGRPRKTDLREIVNAVLYMASDGMPMANATQRLPAGPDSAALFLRVARQRALADDPV